MKYKQNAGEVKKGGKASYKFPLFFTRVRMKIFNLQNNKQQK